MTPPSRVPPGLIAEWTGNPEDQMDRATLIVAGAIWGPGTIDRGDEHQLEKAADLLWETLKDAIPPIGKQERGGQTHTKVLLEAAKRAGNARAVPRRMRPPANGFRATDLTRKLIDHVQRCVNEHEEIYRELSKPGQSERRNKLRREASNRFREARNSAVESHMQKLRAEMRKDIQQA